MFAITTAQPQSSQQQQQQQQQQQLQQQQLQLLKQQQAIIQQAMLQQQAALYHPAILAAMIEPIPSGNLPPGFDATSCRSVYVGNVHSKVTEALLAEVFATAGPLEGCKLIRKEKSSYGFVDYFDHRSAATAILTLNGRQIFSQSIKVNWAYASGQREDTTGHFNIFVGDLSSEVTDATLYAAFSIYASCSDARVMWDQRSGRSRGFGFVSFRNQQDADKAIIEMTGKWLGKRAIRCNWATKTGQVVGSQGEEVLNIVQNAGMHTSGNDAIGEITTTNSAVTNEVQQETDGTLKDAPETNPQFTTVYVGNLAHEVTQVELYRQFHILGAGIIEDVRVQRDKGFGFVRYRTHDEAALAIQLANGKVICGKSVKCSWGNKPTPPGTSSAPLLPPLPVLPLQGLMAASLNQGYTAAELAAYQRQLTLTQAGAGASTGALLPLPSQQMNLAALGVGSRTAYDSLQMAGALGQQQLF